MTPAENRAKKERARHRKRRAGLRDWSVRPGAHRRARIDLGLALLQLCARPGVPLTRADIAAFCGCTDGAIYWIESRALQKLRRALHLRGNPALRELLCSLFELGAARECATPKRTPIFSFPQ